MNKSETNLKVNFRHGQGYSTRNLDSMHDTCKEKYYKAEHNMTCFKAVFKSR